MGRCSGLRNVRGGFRGDDTASVRVHPVTNAREEAAMVRSNGATAAYALRCLRAIRPSALALSAAVSLVGAPAHAVWTRDPAVNLPVSTAAGSQQYPMIVSDGAGGAIITWEDLRGGAYTDIYLHHVLASGVVDPAWPIDGRALCTAANDQFFPRIVSDGSGGAIVAWQDARNGIDYDIYAQRVLASGEVDPLWPIDGRALCAAANDQLFPTVVSDGAGGAIVAWQDPRSGSNNADIYAQHVLVSGAVDPAWPANGLPLCTAAYQQYSPTIVTDGAGGAVVTWQDYRSGTNYDIYAQRVLVSGAVDPAWPANGRALCTATQQQANPTIVADDAGGAIVTWTDYRSGTNNDIYAQRVLGNGAVDPAWPANGRALCTAATNQQGPTIVTDGAGGAIAAWQDLRSGTWDIYAQHVLASGAVDPAWPANGRALCTAAANQEVPTIVTDGAGGAIVAWHDTRSGTSYDVFAQRVLASGAVDPAWPADGRALCTAANSQGNVTIAPDGAGGAIVAWQDYRNGTDYDIYAQHVRASGTVDPAWPVDGRALKTSTSTALSFAIVSDGAGGCFATRSDGDIYALWVSPDGTLGRPEPRLVDVSDVAGDQGGHVTVFWEASIGDIGPIWPIGSYTLWRRITPANAQLALARAAPAAGPAVGDGSPQPGSIRLRGQGAQATYWEYIATVPAQGFSHYAYRVSTPSDSMPGSVPWNLFIVDAQDTTWDVGDFFTSAPDSGYSVDNLVPDVPTPFTGTYGAGTARLHWGMNQEPDLAWYRLYRGSTAGFVPAPGNLIAQQADTGYVDNAGGPYYYKLSAVDVHGNEGASAFLQPSGAVGVQEESPLAFVLEGARPNPARADRLVVAFVLPVGAPARLELFDMSGRRVAARDVGALGPGRHSVDLAGGARVAPGLYFVRLTQGVNVRSARVAVLE